MPLKDEFCAKQYLDQFRDSTKRLINCVSPELSEPVNDLTSPIAATFTDISRSLILERIGQMKIEGEVPKVLIFSTPHGYDRCQAYYDQLAGCKVDLNHLHGVDIEWRILGDVPPKSPAKIFWDECYKDLNDRSRLTAEEFNHLFMCNPWADEVVPDKDEKRRFNERARDSARSVKRRRPWEHM